MTKLSKKIIPKTSLLICIPLVLSAFTHLWNPAGFPPIYIDEGHYLRRTMQVLDGLGPQETLSVYEFPFDHPYFGQIFLAGLLSAVGYPHSINPSVEMGESSVKLLYEIPRIIMGILAIIDTFLIFKIGERWYGRSVGLVSSTLFAVMPVTWFLRMVILENIMLPFLLASILILTYASKMDSTEQSSSSASSAKRRHQLLFFLSGVMFGLASFTKESSAILIPALGYLVYSRLNIPSYGRLKNVGIWLIPVIVFSSVWPLYSVVTNQFDDWLNGIVYQAQREERGLRMPMLDFLQIDPLFAVMSVIAMGFGIFRVIVLKDRDLLLFFWTVPYLLFLFMIGGAVKYFHFIILVPILSIEIGRLALFVSRSIKSKMSSYTPFAVLAVIATIGFVSTIIIVSTDLTTTYFQMYGFILRTLPTGGDNSDVVTMIGKHWARSFYWIPKYIFDQNVEFKVYDPILFPKYQTNSGKTLLLLDRSVIAEVRDNERQDGYIKQLRALYDNSSLKGRFRENWTQSNFTPPNYPYSSIEHLLGGIGRLDIRTNY